MNIYELEQDLGWILNQIEEADEDKKDSVESLYDEKVQDILYKIAKLKGAENG